MRFPTSPVKRLVVIEDSTLASMRNNPAIVAEFPFLKESATAGAAQRIGRGCGGCAGRRLSRARIEAATKLKQSLAGMGDDRKRRLKELLGAQKVRIAYRVGNRIVEHLF